MTPTETAVNILACTLDENTMMPATACLNLVAELASAIEAAVQNERTYWMQETLKRSGDVQAAVLAEREACAEMADEYGAGCKGRAIPVGEFERRHGKHANLSDAIRARKP